ncbi:MAG: sigma-54-dependent Fis family transcriptional regulator [Deltaproteobacteria bacterium]|nr:sigma-54-dependent Fis family transcriptional regulator [Deltaproteobacteria bacterium]
MQGFKILFVDDEKDVLSIVQEYLSAYQYDITVVDSAVKALELASQGDFDVIFTDLKMPDISGLDLLVSIKEKVPACEVVIVTGHGSVESAVEALKLGGYDYIQKPIKLERLKVLVDRIAEKKTLERENLVLKNRLKERYHCYDNMVGVSRPMQDIYDIIDRIKMSSPTVLIYGESGTGKEVLARVIHKNSDRGNKPFVPVNCGAVSEGLLESELFGHIKGSFTGAVDNKIGLFRAAEGGTIFLDEIAKSSPSFQVKLLRVLQEKKIRPVGDIKEIDVDVRVIAAMNGEPETVINEGKLRPDLFYRLNVVSIKLPPLRSRKEDISFLISHFLEKFNAVNKNKISSVSSEAMFALLNYDWPGNVRQLENVIERAFALGTKNTIGISDLPAEIRQSQDTHALKQQSFLSEDKEQIYSLKEQEVALIRRVLQKTNGNKSQAARLLGINVATLYRKIKAYGIKLQ